MEPPLVSAAARAAMRRARRLAAQERASGTEYPGTAWLTFQQSVTLSEAYGELDHIVEELRRTTWFRHIRVLLKMYVIGWMTLSDIVANLVNDALCLGYHEKDISFSAVLRNRHVARTDIPNVVKQHARKLKHEMYSRLRNDVVHRGTLQDSDLVALEKQWAAVVMEKAFEDIRRERNPDEAAEAANAEPAIRDAIREFVDAKYATLRQHLAETRAFLTEFDASLARAIDMRS